MVAISLRRATLQDAAPLFEWRNALEIRRFFFDPKPLEWDAHVAWLDSTLRRADRYLLIGETKGEPVGVLRYDIVAQCAEVSVYLVPGRMDRGIGAQLLEAGNAWLSRQSPDVQTVQARILPDNIRSQKAFLKAGFRHREGKFVCNLPVPGAR